MSTRVLIGDLSKMSTLLANDSEYRKAGVHYGGTINLPGIPEALAAVIRHYRAAKETINKAEDYSDAWKQTQRENLRAWVNGAVATLQNAVEDHTAEHLAKFPVPTTKVDESKAVRVWNRLQRQLDSGVALSDVVNNANAEELQILQEEIGGHYRASMPNDLQTASVLAEGAKDTIDQRRGELDPAVGRMIKGRRDAEQGVKNLEGSFNWAWRAVANDETQHVIGYGRGTAVTI